ncbi:MAG TPA: protein phosphatase 2C domain-containing protein [Gemmatimonadaceae bacterium]|nr:protein phosphatase 2C domain-containing protein [Gemmatimonadaceae bacterium]
MPPTTASPVTVDSAAVTDVGRKRSSNEDHFVIATVSKALAIGESSLPEAALANRFGASVGHLFAVADGVGGRPDGDVAAQWTVAELLDYLGEAAGCYQGLDTAREQELLARLEDAVRSVHVRLMKEYGGERALVPASTLTMVLLVWPRAYLVHVGDSRAYVFRRGRLQRLTRDQTFGEYMLAAGAWTEAQATKPGPATTLASAIGGTDLTPVVGLIDLEPGDSLLLCTDGLNKHVSDERLASVLEGSGDARTIARRLVDEALADGGSDNVTVVVVRTGDA